MADDKKTVVKMAYIYSQEGRWDKAAAEYKKLISMDPEDFNARNMLGDVFVKRGEHQPAFDSYVAVADAYNRLGQIEKSMVVYRKIAKLDASQLSGDAKKKQILLQKQVEGEVALEAGDLVKAAEAFKMVLQLDSERFDIYQKLGDIYLQQGKIEQAVKQYSEIADIYFKNKLYKKAAPLYKKITELDSGHVGAHAGLGEIHVHSGNESEAKKEYLFIAESMLAKGDLETSMSYSKKALQLKSIEAYYFLGRVFLLQKKFEDAKSEFEKLLKFKLNHVGALVSMGGISEAKGEPAEAQQYYERALKAEKNNVEALAALALIHVKKGDNAQAIILYGEAEAACAAMNDQVRAAEYRSLVARIHPDNQDAVSHFSGSPLSDAPITMTAVAPISNPVPVRAVPEAVMPTAAKPVAGPAPHSEIDSAEERAILMSMADNYVMEKSYDEAIELYHRILAANPVDKEAKDALAGVYGMVAKGAIVNSPPQAPVSDAKHLELAQAAAEELAKAEKVEAHKVAESEMRKHLEIEIRKQIEEELHKKVNASSPAPLAVAPQPAPAPHEIEILKKKSKVSYL